MAKVVTKTVREEGVRVITLMMDNSLDWELPDGAEVLVDGLLELDNPEPSTSGKTHSAFYMPIADRDNPHVVDAIIDNEVVRDVAIGGQVSVFLSVKAIEAARKRQTDGKAKRSK